MAAIAGGYASWVDIENDASIVDALAAAIAARAGAQLIVSHHDFARTPPLDALLAVVDRCHAIPGAVAKIATAVQTDDDRRTLLELLARRPDRTCVIGMGASADLRIELGRARLTARLRLPGARDRAGADVRRRDAPAAARRVSPLRRPPPGATER